MKRLAWLLLLVFLVGCTVPDPSPEIAPIGLEVVDDNQGWVKVRVTGISETGYEIHWGDADPSYGVDSLAPWDDEYTHFYQPIDGEVSGSQTPTTYTITVRDSKGTIRAMESIYVAASVCHLELISLIGREITVEYWGCFGIEYSISWGDRFADHVMVSTQSGRGTATHTYAAPGTYSLGMEEIWAPPQIFFTIAVD